jgi:hypothetical protein
MDLLRSGKKALMQTWDSGPPVPVVWFRVPRSTPFFPGSTPFRAINYLMPTDNMGLGEQQPYDPDPCKQQMPWYRGNYPAPYLGINYCGDLDTWRNGGVRGVTPPIITDAQGRCPDCALPSFVMSGGLKLGNTDRVCVDPDFLSAGGAQPGPFVLFAPSVLPGTLVVLALLSQDPTLTMPSLPSGYTLLRDWTGSGSAWRVGYRILQSGDTVDYDFGTHNDFLMVFMAAVDAAVWAVAETPVEGTANPVALPYLPCYDREYACLAFITNIQGSATRFSGFNYMTGGTANGVSGFVAGVVWQQYYGPGSFERVGTWDVDPSYWSGFQVVVAYTPCYRMSGGYSQPMSGGIRLGGSAQMGPGFVGSGGIRLGGAAQFATGEAMTGSGGIRLGGSAAFDVGSGMTGSGGIRLGGAVAFARGVGMTGSGGIRLGGAVAFARGVGMTGSGGVRLGGTAVQSGGTSCSPPTFRSDSTNSGAPVSSLTISKPSGTAFGDGLVAYIATAMSTTVTLPTGWFFGTKTGGTLAVPAQLYIAYKLAGSSEPSSYTFSFSGPVGALGVVVAMSNSADYLPDALSGGTGSSTGATAPAVVSTDDCTIPLAGFTSATPVAWTLTSAGWTTIANITSMMGNLLVAYGPEINTGGSSAATATQTGVAPWSACEILVIGP